MAPIKLVEKRADNDFLHGLRAFTAGQFTRAELDALAATIKGARTPVRPLRRKGYEDREQDIRAGRIALEMPKPRKGSYLPRFAEPC